MFHSVDLWVCSHKKYYCMLAKILAQIIRKKYEKTQIFYLEFLHFLTPVFRRAENVSKNLFGIYHLFCNLGMWKLDDFKFCKII